jgi:uncharacterized membrane protein YcaP (DUF421 family)
MSDLGISWAEAGLVVLAASGIYVLAVALVRVGGPRAVATFTTFDFVVSVAIGAVVGRVVLVEPTLAAGAIGLLTLFVLERVVGRLRRGSVLEKAVDASPRLLVRDGVLQHDEMHAAGLRVDDVHELVRRRGFGSLADLGAVVLERNGEVSVIPVGRRLDDELLDDVVGWSRGADG